MTTTTKRVGTSRQIADLRQEAAQAGDERMISMCDRCELIGDAAAQFASDTAADMNDTVLNAIKAMRDEAGEVGRCLKTDDITVRAWTSCALVIAEGVES